MTLVHRGFDYLALAIKAHIPEALFEFIDAEKKTAEEERQDRLIEYNGLKFHLKPHGSTGYQFLLSGGSNGAQWAFKKPHAKDPWGVRVIFGSDFMAVYGLGHAKAHVEDVTAALGIRYTAQDISISRVDFCADILAPDFILNPDQFVMHSRAGRRDYVTAEDQSIHGHSGRVTSVTVGSITNRQVIIYDKRAEIIARGKTHWWAIWDKTLANLASIASGDAPSSSLPSKLARDDPGTSRVWRVELRAGKTLLKERWNIRTWADLFARFGDLCRETGEVVRYTDPDPGDSNRARWPNHLLWEIATAEINDDLTELRSGVDPIAIKEVHKETHISMILRNITGCAITHAALNDVEFDALPTHFANLAHEMSVNFAKQPDKARKQLDAAKAKYVFITGPEKS